jgi:hypothetical protein
MNITPGIGPCLVGYGSIVSIIINCKVLIKQQNNTSHERSCYQKESYPVKHQKFPIPWEILLTWRNMEVSWRGMSHHTEFISHYTVYIYITTQYHIVSYRMIHTITYLEEHVQIAPDLDGGIEHGVSRRGRPVGTRERSELVGRTFLRLESAHVILILIFKSTL